MSTSDGVQRRDKANLRARARWWDSGWRDERKADRVCHSDRTGPVKVRGRDVGRRGYSRQGQQGEGLLLESEK